jgi:biopolymer transport protein ExbD
MRPIHARKRRRCTRAPKLSMAAMIDVVFLLLVFFVVTTVPQDVMAQLRGARARQDDTATPPTVPLVNIDIHAGGYVMNGRPVTLDTIDSFLTRVARISTRQTIVIASTPEAQHEGLIEVLDLCAKAKLGRIVVMSR